MFYFHTPRGQNMLSKESLFNEEYYVEGRLRRWGHWSMRCLTGGLGFPTRSEIGRLIDNGGILSKSTAPYHEITDDECSETDVAVNQLHICRPRLARIIVIKYTSANVKQKILAEGINYEAYKKDIKVAKAWISGMLVSKVRPINDKPF